MFKKHLLFVLYIEKGKYTIVTSVLTPAQRKIIDSLPQDNLYPDGDASQARIEVLGLVVQKEIGELVYTVLIRDPLNLKEPVGADIHVYTRGTMQGMRSVDTVAAEGVPLDEIEVEFDIEVAR